MDCKIFIAILFSLLISSESFATGFSLGTGDYWIELCEGNNSDFSPEASKQTCNASLMMFQFGAIAQALELDQKPTLCSEEVFGEEAGVLFINFIKSKPSRSTENFIELFPEFLKSMNSCETGL